VVGGGAALDSEHNKATCFKEEKKSFKDYQIYFLKSYYLFILIFGI
jgi:hypothetical protein